MRIKKNRLSVFHRQPFLKATGIVFILIAIIVAQIPVPDVLASDAGTEFKMDGSTLVEYTGTKSSVSLPAKVTAIGAEAFADQESLELLTIPDTVTQIGSSAFSGCTSLKSVSIPDSVTEIDSSAFYDCTNLQKVTIGKGLTTLGTGVFSNCDKLEVISVNSENAEFIFENGALYSKDKTILCQVLGGKKTDLFKVPDTVTVVMPYAFWGCKGIQSVVLSSTMKEVGPYALSNCSSMKSVEIPFSVRSIQLKAFSDCVSLSEAEVPDSVTFIHDTAFDGCVLMNQEGDGVSGNSVSENTAQAEGTTTEEKDSKQDVSSNGVKKETLDNTVSANNPMDYNTTIAEDTSEEGILGKTIIVGKNAVILMNNQNASVISGNLQNSKTVSDNTVLSEDGTSIIKQSFYRDDSLVEYQIPENVITIEEFAFARSGLQKIEIPNHIQKIGYAAFYHCDALNEIRIPDSVTEIEGKAFEKTPWMNQWRNSETEDFLVVGDGILIAYKGNNSIVTLPETVKQIASGAFEANEIIEEVILSKEIWAIRDHAFLNCTNLKTMTCGDSITLLEEKAFEGTNILMSGETVQTPKNASMQSVGEYQILNKSEYNRNAMLLNLMKWSAITGMVVIAGCLILVRKKRS